MILLIECEIDTDTLADEMIDQKFHPYTVKFYPDERHRLNRVTIERPFANYEKYIPRINHADGQIKEIVLPEGNFFQEQIELLQYLESFAALDLGFRKIHYENPCIHWIAENEKEQSQIAINSYSANRDYAANNRQMTKGWLQSTIIHRNMVKHLKEPLSFYRLGANFYFEQLYIISFLNFFLVLEGLFSEGNTNKNFMIEAFMQSLEIEYGIAQTFEMLDKPNQQVHKSWFEQQVYQNQDINDDPKLKLLNVLYDKRGLLSHYSMNSSRKRYDFEQQQYHSLAFLAMSICYFCSIKVRLAPFKQKEDALGSTDEQV
ncbi:MAG: hypothetical protein ABIN91_00065 [Mucilaginibacter sp.]|uniref:hypothetical protein n=1 Tax=Mucilaginibacter sp. TaxID=1882438 RepID=UPI003264EF61